MKLLDVNADDFNLTQGVSEGIFRCFDDGIVSSTSLFINLPLTRRQLMGLKKRKHLGKGLHLNITYGEPVQSVQKVRSLIKRNGTFKRNHTRPRLKEVEAEYQAQLNRYLQIFGKLPDHLDTHHHIHANQAIFQIVQKLSRKHCIPMRRVAGLGKNVITTEYFFGSIGFDRHWTMMSLMPILKCLPHGTSELMCHPGRCDSELRQISSLNDGRAVELKLFSDPRLRQLLKQENIILSKRAVKILK